MPSSSDMPPDAPAAETEETIWRGRLDCAFAPVQTIFSDCLAVARARWKDDELAAYMEAARLLCKLGRGSEPVLAFLEGWPEVAQQVGTESLEIVIDWVKKIQRTVNGNILGAFFQALPQLSKSLSSPELLQDYLELLTEVGQQSSASIHGHHTILPSQSLPVLVHRAPDLLQQVSLRGLRAWTEYGLRHYPSNPERQADFFALQSADSRAVFQSQRGGVLLHRHERELDFYLRALWNDPEPLIPYSEAFDLLRKAQPYLNAQGLHIPDIREDRLGVPGLLQYHLILAHLAAHRRYSQSLLADNLSPFLRLTVEFFEDARIDTLLLQRFPGLRGPLLALHPHPREEACDPERESCIRHRLTMLSRAILDPQHGYRNPILRHFVERFHTHFENANTHSMVTLATEYLSQTRLPSDAFAKMFFTDTVTPYRDDNRHLWRFVDADEERDDADVKTNPATDAETALIFHYPEWDYANQSYLPDWVSLYEHIHPSGSAAEIERILQKHAALAKQLGRLLDQVKPQDRERLRRQEEGSDLDLDWALRSWIDYRSRQPADPRIHQSFQPVRRDLAVSLLLDLSASLNDPVRGNPEQSFLALAQEAVTLLAWAIDRLGDTFSIAGFHSNTRHEVRYWHIKGFSESWQDAVRARLAALQAGYSTRMGSALRHAGHYLSGQRKDKRILLILTDGQPADVDVSDPEFLIADARQAVLELQNKGVFCHCISLDPHADDYVRKIFGQQFSIIDRVERLPEKLPEIFLALTK